MDDIVINSLAIAGIVYLFRYTDGPWDVFLNFRIQVGVYELQNEDGTYKEFVEEKFLAKLFACHWCLTTWVALFSTFKLDILFFISWLSTIYLTGLLLEIVLFLRRN